MSLQHRQNNSIVTVFCFKVAMYRNKIILYIQTQDILQYKRTCIGLSYYVIGIFRYHIMVKRLQIVSLIDMSLPQQNITNTDRLIIQRTLGQ